LGKSEKGAGENKHKGEQERKRFLLGFWGTKGLTTQSRAGAGDLGVDKAFRRAVSKRSIKKKRHLKGKGKTENRNKPLEKGGSSSQLGKRSKGVF